MSETQEAAEETVAVPMTPSADEMPQGDAPGQELAEAAPAGALVTVNFEEDEDTEVQTQDDVTIPYLVALQDNSKQMKDRTLDLQVGDLFNTVTKQSFDATEGVIVVPCTREVYYTEYIPRKRGGGFQGRHRDASPVVRAALARARQVGVEPFPKLYTEYTDQGVPMVDSSANELVRTIYLYCLVLDDEGREVMGAAVLPFDSTDIKFWKEWNTTRSSFMLPRSKPAADGSTKFKPKMFAHRVRVTTHENPYTGGSCFNYKLTPAFGTIEESLTNSVPSVYAQAKAFATTVAGGGVKTGDLDQGGDDTGGDDIPF